MRADDWIYVSATAVAKLSPWLQAENGSAGDTGKHGYP